jgi:hypothetical protein
MTWLGSAARETGSMFMRLFTDLMMAGMTVGVAWSGLEEVAGRPCGCGEVMLA